MENEESKQAHIYWDENCQCDSCRRWDDDDRIELTPQGVAALAVWRAQHRPAQTGQPEGPA